MRKYKAIFFDWDGTAVMNRSDAGKIAPVMAKLMDKEVRLVIISGTTYKNISGGNLSRYFSERQLENLYLGLGRGAYNYGFNKQGEPVVLSCILPNTAQKVKIHKAAFDMHISLLEKYGFESDIVFTRPNYCKIDLLVDINRSDKLFLQPDEVGVLQDKLLIHGVHGGIKYILDMAVSMGEKHGIQLKATTDAKYLELGMSTKTDNVDYFIDTVLGNKGIKIEECCFWGDEFTYLGDEIYGSDAFMITEKSKAADFFDVSEKPIKLPDHVVHHGGGVTGFHDFLQEQLG